MPPMDVTIVIELLLRRPGTVIDGRAIARALRRIGLDTTADIVDIRVILGTVQEVVEVAMVASANRHQPLPPRPVHGLTTARTEEDLVLLAAEGR